MLRISTLSALAAVAAILAPATVATAHEVNHRGRVLLVDPVFDHPARPRNEVGFGSRLLSLSDENDETVQAWAFVLGAEVGREDVFSVGARAVLVETLDFASGARDVSPLSTFDAWVAFAVINAGFPWRVVITPAILGGANWDPEDEDFDPFARVELRAAIQVGGIDWLSFAARQALELNLVNGISGTPGIAWSSFYAVGFAPHRTFSFLVELSSRVGRAPGATSGPVQARPKLGPGLHFAPVRGWRVDLGIRFPLVTKDGFGYEAVLVVRREFFARSW